MEKRLIGMNLKLCMDNRYNKEVQRFERSKDIHEKPLELDGILTYMAGLVQPGVIATECGGGYEFSDFLKNCHGYGIDSTYKKEDGEEGLIRFINWTKEELSLVTLSPLICMFFNDFMKVKASLCFICKEYSQDFVLREKRGAIPFALELSNVYSDGKVTNLYPKGRVVTIKIPSDYQGI